MKHIGPMLRSLHGVSHANRVVIAVLVIATLLATLVTFDPSTVLLTSGEGALSTIALLVVSAYAPGLIRDLNRKVDGTYVLRLGVVVAWFATLFWSLWRLADIWFDGAPVYVVSIRAYLIELLIVAGLMHVMAIGMIEGRPVWRNVWIATWTVVVGAVISGGISLLLGFPWND